MRMVVMWTLLVIVASMQFVHPATLRNSSATSAAPELSDAIHEAGGIHQKERAKPIIVDFDDMFPFGQPSGTKEHERHKRDAEDAIETEAEIFSDGPGTSLDVHSMPMTTLDDSEHISSGENELVEDLREDIVDDDEGDANETEDVGEDDSLEEAHMSNIDDANLNNIENVEMEKSSVESKMNELSSENDEELNKTHVVPTTINGEIKPEEITGSKEDSSLDISSEVESEFKPHANDKDSKDEIRKEESALSKEDDAEKEVVEISDDVEVLPVKSDETSFSGKLRAVTDDEDEDWVGSGSGDIAQITDSEQFSVETDTTKDETKDETKNDSNHSGVEDDSDELIGGDENEEVKEESDETPKPDPNVHSPGSNSSAVNDFLVENDDSNEEESFQESFQRTFESNEENSDTSVVESEDNEEKPSPDPISNSSESSDTHPIINTSGSGDDTDDLESVDDGENDIESDDIDETPLPDPLGNANVDSISIENDDNDDDGDDDETPIPNPLEVENEADPPVNSDQTSVETDARPIVEVDQPTPTDSKILAVTDEVEGSGNSFIDDLSSGESEDTLIILPPLFDREVSKLGSSPTGEYSNNKREGSHEEENKGELPASKGGNEDINVIPGIIEDIPNIPIIVSSEDAKDVKALPGNNSNRIGMDDNISSNNEPNSINEIGVKTDEKEEAASDPEKASTSSGSYIVLGAIMIVIVGLLCYTVIKSKRQKQEQRNLRNKPKEDEKGTELKEIEALLNHDGTNGKGPANNVGGESDGLLSRMSELDEAPPTKPAYPAERPDLPSNGFGPHTQPPISMSSPKVENKLPSDLSEVTVEKVPQQFATMPVIANGGLQIPHMTPSDSDNGSNGESSDDRGSWVYGNNPLETTKIKMFIDHDSIPKTPIVIVKRGGTTVEM